MSDKLTIQKINDIEVKPLKTKNVVVKPARGADMFTDPYFQCFILSRKKSGKSVLISNIVKKCAQPGYTTVICFSTTVNKDPAWLALKQYCKKKGIDFQGLTEIVSTDQNGSKRDFLSDFMKMVLKTGNEEVVDSEAEDEAEDSQDEDSQDDYDSEESDSEPEFYQVNRLKPIKFVQDTPSIKKEYPTIAPQWLLCFDDISEELKRPSVQAFLKKSRHLLCSVLIASQDCRDILPACHRQADAYCLFAGLDDSVLEKIRRDAGLSVSLETLLKMYRASTAKKFNFFYIDVRNDQFRRNFNEKFNIISNK